MESSLQSTQTEETSMFKNAIRRYLVTLNNHLYFGGQPTEAWLFRDDIGAPHGIKGYEEQVNSVGMHHGINHWPSEITWNTYNSATYLQLYQSTFI